MQILTDVSCYKNPSGLSGCAAIVFYPDDSKPEDPEEQIVDFGVMESNISRMELMACNRAMEWLCEQGRPGLGDAHRSSTKSMRFSRSLQKSND